MSNGRSPLGSKGSRSLSDDDVLMNDDPCWCSAGVLGAGENCDDAAGEMSETRQNTNNNNEKQHQRGCNSGGRAQPDSARDDTQKSE